MFRCSGFVLLAGLLAASPVSADTTEEQLARGEYLVHAAGCITCHSDPSDKIPPFAGGRELETPFGTFYPPNITPNAETGIGNWTDREFLTAFWDGLSPGQEDYYPAFPYTSYTGLSAEDLLAIKAYLFSLAPVHQPNREHLLPWYLSERALIRPWKALFFRSGRYEPDAQRTDEWNRGAYLVRHLAHCGECHTPRNLLGASRYDQQLAGGGPGPYGDSAPNITPNREHGIGDWSKRDLDYLLEFGMLPDGDFAGDSMSDVIEDSTSHLTPEDRRAIAVYIGSLPPLGGRGSN
ncbi:MAG: cytochrome c [Gammaproteobacteria bacterium]|nr:cytochrome c [Gammaproteobacteria bacterium]